jgi:hypothetical protein
MSRVPKETPPKAPRRSSLSDVALETLAIMSLSHIKCLC